MWFIRTQRSLFTKGPFTGGGMFTSRPSAVTYSAEATAFFARLATQPTTARKILYAAMIDALTAGGVWTKLDALYLFAAADAATALTNLVQTTYGASAVNAPTFTADTGYTGASTAYVDTTFNPSSATTPKFLRNDASASGWSLDTGTSAGALFGGANAANRIELYPRYSDNNIYGAFNGTGEITVTTSVATAIGHQLYTRVGSAGFDYYRNASLVSSCVQVSTAVVNDTIAFLANATDYWTGKRVAAGHIGGGLTSGEVTTLYNAVHTYLQAVAGVA